MSNDKRNEFHGELLDADVLRKQIIELGKVSRTPPEVGIFDPPTRCFIVNLEWWSHIAGMVHWLADVTAWQDAEDESYFAIREILRFMQGIECMEFQLRQNPEDSCILQQTLDGGTTWTDVFDFSLCQSIVDGSSQTNIVNNFYNTSFQTFQNNVYNNYVNNYAGDITNIHPELGYGDADDDFRDDALCYSLGKLIDAVCDSANKFFDEQAEVGNDLKTALAIAVAIIGIIALAATGVGTPAAAVLATQAGLWAAGIGIASALGTALYDHFIDTNQAAYNDSVAKDELLCCLLGNMEGANPDHAALIAAFSCEGLSENAQAIHDAAAILVAELAMYAAFAENMAIGFQSAKLGLLPSCSCTDPFEPAITHNEPCSVAVSSSGTIVGEQSLNVWRLSSSSYVEAGTQGISFADMNGRLFRITNAVKVSGADIFSFTVADTDCVTSNGFNLDFGGQDIRNIVVLSDANAPFTYDFTVELLG